MCVRARERESGGERGTRTPVCPAPAYGNVEVITEPYSYLLQVPGKGVRTQLIKAFNVWLGVPDRQVQEISAIVQMLHTASLLIDDIEDNSTLRRGIPVAHAVYGVPWTINCGNYMYFKAMERCTAMGSAEATHHFLKEMLRLHRGQGFDLYWRDSGTCPTEEEYIRMVEDKTGGLFRLAIHLMSVFSSCESDFIPLVTKLGVYFQIRDDYVNLCSSEYFAAKTYCEDLSEGKFSFPIIHCVASNPTDRRLLNILKQRPTDVDIKKYAVEYMELAGSFAYTRARLDDVMREIRAEYARFPPNAALEAILDRLASFERPQDERGHPTLRLSSEDIQDT